MSNLCIYSGFVPEDKSTTNAVVRDTLVACKVTTQNTSVGTIDADVLTVEGALSILDPDVPLSSDPPLVGDGTTVNPLGFEAGVTFPLHQNGDNVGGFEFGPPTAPDGQWWGIAVQASTKFIDGAVDPTSSPAGDGIARFTVPHPIRGLITRIHKRGADTPGIMRTTAYDVTGTTVLAGPGVGVNLNASPAAFGNDVLTFNSPHPANTPFLVRLTTDNDMSPPIKLDILALL
jgi:hypothetical protein